MASACYGLTPLFSKHCLLDGLNPFTIMTFRYIVTVPIIILILLVKKTSLKISKKSILHLAIASIFGPMLASGTLVLSYQHIESGLATVLHYIYPLTTAIAAYFVFKEAFTKNKILALISSLLGVGLISHIGDTNFEPIGILLALFSGIAYTVYILLISPEEIKKIDPYVASLYLFSFATIFFLLVDIPYGHIQVPNTSSQWINLVGLGLFPTTFAMSFFFIGVKNIGPSKASILCTCEPVVSIVIGMLVFDEVLNALDIIGCIFVFSSIFFISMPAEFFKIKKKSKINPVNKI